MREQHRFIAIMALMMVMAGIAVAQPPSAALPRPALPLTDQQAAGGRFKIDDQGTVIKPAAQVHLDAAEQAAGSDFVGPLLLCNAARPAALKRAMPSANELRSEGGVPGQHPEPTQVFDHFYYLGVENVTAWAVVTHQGIILIDALNNKTDWIEQVEPGMRKLGLDPAQIKYVVVTHGHGDHFGGTAYLAQTYHARILMSAVDWTLAPTMLDKPTFDAPAPRDLVIHDGEKLTLGAQTITLYLTPGHTPGTVSVLIPVTDHGRRHVAALWGGTGFNFPHSPARFKQYSASAQRFMRIARAARADVPLSNHPETDAVVKKLAQLQQRRAQDRNPFVLGQDGVGRFLTIVSECALAYGAQISD